MRIPFVILAVLVTLAAFVAGGRLASAPRNDKPVAPDQLAGILGTEQSSPVLLVPRGDGGDGNDVVWLVFRQEFSQDAALADVAPGRKVTLRGNRGQGGAFSYLIVAEVLPAD